MSEILRQCISCRTLFARTVLIRLTCDQVAAGTAEIRFSIDNDPPLQGRSAYVCRNARCLGEALKAKKFQRTLKRAIPDDILRSLNVQLEGMNSE